MGGNESFFGRNIAERGGDEGMYPMMLKKKKIVISIRGRVLCYNYLEGFFSVVNRAMNGLCGEVRLASATLLFDSVRSGHRT